MVAAGPNSALQQILQQIGSDAISSDERRDIDASTLADSNVSALPVGDLAKRGEGGLTSRERSNKNLCAPWKPGESGNLKGRPKGPSITDRVLKLLGEQVEDGKDGETKADKVAKRIVDAAIEGDFRFVKEIVDRVDGPVKQQIEASLVMFAKAIDRGDFNGA